MDTQMNRQTRQKHYTSSHITLGSSGGCRICQRGVGRGEGERGARGKTMVSVWSVSLNGAPSGVQGQSSWWGEGGKAPLKLKGFCQFSYKKVAKS